MKSGTTIHSTWINDKTERERLVRRGGNGSGIFGGMLMDIQLRFRSFLTSTDFISANKRKSSASSFKFSTAKPFCSARKSPEPPENGDDNEAKGKKSSTDWDRAWSIYKKQGKKSKLSQFSPNKYVSWNPRRSEYPLSEEVDPIKRAERSNLMLWTGPGFTLAGAIVIVSFLLLYTILAPIK